MPAQYEWEVADLSAPLVTIDSGPQGTVDATSARFDFSANEPATFECSLDGAPFGACHSGIEYTGLDRGAHTFTVQATDLSEGENLSATETRTWTVADLTAPTITFSEKPAATTSETNAQFAFSTLDNWGGVITTECRLDGAAFAACDSPEAFSGLSAAPHTFEVRATDAAGNARTESHSWTVEDIIDPEAQITGVTTGSLIVEFTGTDDHTAAADLQFECRVDSGTYAACTSPKTYSDADLAAMTPGQHTVQVRAIDESGNVGQPDSRTFTVADTGAPDTSITGQPTNNTTNVDATFAFTGADNVTPAAGLTFQCRLDTGSFAACSSPRTYTGLTVGQHTFEVRATDAAGNTDAVPASYTWTIQAAADTVAPDTSITQQPPATTTETTAAFEFVSTESGSTFECKLDSGSYGACSSPKAYSGLAVGSHTFSVRATDAAGNLDQTAATYTWTVESATVDCGPQQTLTATADAWIDSGSTTSNKGSDSILKVMSKNGGNLRALVRFDLPTMPQGCSVESATLQMYAKSAAGGRSLEVLQVAGSWTEGGVTWANQPATTGIAATTTSGTGYRDWNVAGMVQAMYTGANHGLLVRDAAENQDAEQQFHSREESTNRPLLVIRFGAGAPPDGVPDTQITGNPLPATPSTSASFTFTGTDDSTPAGSLTFECQLDVAETAPWAACASPRSYSDLATGLTPSGSAPSTALVPSTRSRPSSRGPSTGRTPRPSSPPVRRRRRRRPTRGSSSSRRRPVRRSSARSTTRRSPRAPHRRTTRAWRSANTPSRCARSTPPATWTSRRRAWCGRSSRAGRRRTAAQRRPCLLSPTRGSSRAARRRTRAGTRSSRSCPRAGTRTCGLSCGSTSRACRQGASSTRPGCASTRPRRRAASALSRPSGSAVPGPRVASRGANAPATTGSAVTTTSGSGYREWNVAGLVQAMLSSGTNNGFLIRDASENQDAEQQLHAREKGNNMPQLVLTFRPAT